jgi:hypothetical protein
MSIGVLNMDEDAAWKLEERFWLEGSSVYDAHLDPACLMAFPGAGVMRATEILESLKEAPRWASVQMTARTVGRSSGNILVLGYRAEGLREGSQTYVVFCTSTYYLDGAVWKLVQHQQTLDG